MATVNNELPVKPGRTEINIGSDATVSHRIVILTDCCVCVVLIGCGYKPPCSNRDNPLGAAYFQSDGGQHKAETHMKERYTTASVPRFALMEKQKLCDRCYPSD